MLTSAPAGPALHDEPAVGHAELDRTDRERLARDHGDRALEAAELRVHQRERVAARVELGLERRRAELAIVRPDGRARRHRAHAHAREHRLQRDLEFLALAAARDLEAQALLRVVRRRRSSSSRVPARSSCSPGSLPTGTPSTASVASMPPVSNATTPRQALERDDEALAGFAADRGPAGAPARSPPLRRPARSRRAARDSGPRSRDRRPCRRNRRRRSPPPGWMRPRPPARRRGRPRTAAASSDAAPAQPGLRSRARPSRARRRLARGARLVRRRSRSAGGRPRRWSAAGPPNAGGRVTFATPPWRTTIVARPSASSSVMATPSSASAPAPGSGVTAMPRVVSATRARTSPGRQPGTTTAAPGPPTVSGSSDGRIRAFAERVLQPQFLQIGSSHLTTTAAAPAPGGSTTSRRTSRYPLRVPTTV